MSSSSFVDIPNPFEDENKQQEFQQFVQDYLLKKFEKQEASKRLRETVLDYAHRILETRESEFAAAQAILEKHQVSEEFARLYFRHEGPVTKKKEFRLPRMVRDEFNLLRRVCRLKDEADDEEAAPVKILCRSRSFETEIEARSYCYDHDVYEWTCGVNCTLRDMERFFRIFRQLRTTYPAVPNPSEPVDIYMEFWILVR